MSLTNDYKPFLREAWNKAGFDSMAPIQQQTIPLIEAGIDCIAESPTGSGKTLAYLIPLLNKLDPEVRQIQVLILLPTRELTMQVHSVIQEFTIGSNINSAAFIGGADMKRQVEKLKKHPQIVVGTPNRISELIKLKKMKVHEVKTIVMDEADQLMNQQIVGSVEEVVKATLKDRQLLFFSATLPERIENKARQFAKEPKILKVGADRSKPSSVDHIYFVCERNEKPELIRKIARMSEGKTLAFINNSKFVDRLAERLENQRLEFDILNGDALKTEREAIIKNFRSGKLSLLIATDVAARGLDVKGLTKVVHYDIPEKANQYVHRSGRTGRMGASGTVISLVTPSEEKLLQRLAKETKITIERKVLREGKILDYKQRV